MKRAYPYGYVLIAEGKCPIAAQNPLCCMVCRFGHMTECHHPLDCRAANCSHYQRQQRVQEAEESSKATR